MTENWREAISEFIQLGCSIKTFGENLTVKWGGKGNPPPKEKFSSLVEVLKVHKEEILSDPYFLIEQTFREINEVWKPGFLNYLKFSQPKQWEKMLRLEEEINQCALKNDLDRLKKNLCEYRELLTGIVKQVGIAGKQRELSFQQDACRQ